MIYIVVAILVLEVVRLSVQLIDSHRVHKLNKEMAHHFVSKEAEWLEIRKAEIEGIKDLVKGSKVMEGIVEDFKKVKDDI